MTIAKNIVLTPATANNTHLIFDNEQRKKIKITAWQCNLNIIPTNKNDHHMVTLEANLITGGGAPSATNEAHLTLVSTYRYGHFQNKSMLVMDHELDPGQDIKVKINDYLEYLDVNPAKIELEVWISGDEIS